MGSTMRIGGLASGLDVDSIVEKLMTAERIPLDKLEQQKQIYEWQRDAYRSVNTKLQTFDTYIVDNLLLKSFNTKTATSTNTSLVEVKATGSATGMLTIEGVSQLATAARAVGNQVSATGTTKLSDLFASSGITINNNYIEIRAIQSDGTLATKATKIEFTQDMTVNEFVNKINNSNAGVTAIFENGRLSITAKNTGDVKGGAEIVVDSGKEVFEAFGFSITGNALADNGKNAIFQINGIATERSTNTFSISGYSITLKSTFNSVQTIAAKYTAAKTELDLAKTNLIDKTQKLNDAKNDYYGVGATSTPSYTSVHDNAYITAFGNTLSLSQQQAFNKLGSAFWKNLSDEVIQYIIDSQNDPNNDFETLIQNSPYSSLSSLNPDQIQVLKDLSQSDIISFQFQAYYQAHSSKYKDLDSTAIGKIQAFTSQITAGDDLDTIKTKIESYFDSNDETEDKIKNLLLSFDNEADLKSFLATSSVYEQKAQADDLKAKYNAIGDAVFNALDSDDLYELMNNVDFNQPISAIADSDLRTKLENLKISPEQFATLGSIVAAGKLSEFKDLADQNIKRSNYLNAQSELNAAQARVNTAQANFDTAQLDAKNAGILNNVDTPNEEINESAVNNAPQTSAVTITATTNVDDIISKIKDFVKTYNGLITELNNLLKESKYKDYPPLTEAQRKEMDEKEIELWEQKAKSGLLKNDSILREALSGLRAIVYESYPAVSNSKYNSLFSIGITTTSSYNDGGLLEIDEDKLRKALEEDPDAVATLFTNTGKAKDTVTVNGETKTVDTRGYLKRIRDTISSIKTKIENKAGRSTMTANQYTLGKSLLNIEERIKAWKDKLETIENRYWKQFTALETAVNKYNTYASLFTPPTA